MKIKTHFVCNECGSVSPKWMGRCSDCGSWNSFTEEVIESKKSSAALADIGDPVRAQRLSDVELSEEHRSTTNNSELDRVLGGGIVDGSLILVGGEPGIGKSTLLLQMADSLARQGKRVLYVSGEESKHQIKMRANRLGVEGEGVLLLSETTFEKIYQTIRQENPDILILDSIQTMSTMNLSAAPGSVSQVREVTSQLTKIAKGYGIATFIVGHVTKSGSLAGPKVLEHMVDTVLYFEGDGNNLYRILRAVKNRFGSTNEVGLFSMSGRGLQIVSNPSELFLSHSRTNESGTVVFASIEGTRPLLVEIQSLVSPTNFAAPRRMALGVDYNKLVLTVAILEKKRGLFMQNQDIYVNAVGGITLNEPALTLPMMVSIGSSYFNQPIPRDMVFFGEVGLLGEVRSVPQVEQRLTEAKRQGYKRAMIPGKTSFTLEGMEILGVRNVHDVFHQLNLGRKSK